MLRFYPLRASMNRLRDFCDDYLNLVPPEIACFRPAIPYVLLSAIHYPEMTPEMRTAGWVSQNEVVFSVLLDWFRVEDGREVYIGPASVSPFIFVDDDASQATGREVYGWPKVQGWHAKFDPYARAPDVRQHPLIKLESYVFPEAFGGQTRERRIVLEIDYEQPSMPFRIPPDLRSPFNPISGISEIMLSAMESWARLTEIAAALPARGFEPLDLLRMPVRLQAMMQQMQQLAAPTADTVNLKQFRDAENPNAVCYQALIRSRMELKCFHRGGLLGGENLLTGDRSGGFRVLLHRYPNIPIVQELGIESQDKRSGDDRVQVITPEFPFWAEVDMRYTRGENLAWRTRRSNWHHFVEKSGKRLIESVHNKRRKIGNPFNTARGAAVLSILPPFRFPNALVRVMPLQADPKKLRKFVDKYLNEAHKQDEPLLPVGLDGQDKYVFKPFGRYVYLLAINFTEVRSRTVNIGQWAQHEVRFSIPVKCYRKSNNTLETIGLVSPFTYSDTEIGTAIGREIFGWPTIQCAIKSDRRNWLLDSETDQNPERLLRVDVPMLDAIGQSQERRPQRLLEITTVKNSKRGQPEAFKWEDTLRTELKRKVGLCKNCKGKVKALVALGMEPLANGKSVPEFSVKQFRDAEQPERACYQAIIRTPMLIKHVRRIWEFDSEPVRIGIRRTKGQPILDTLGLLTRHEEDDLAILEPVRPFSMQLRLDLERGCEIWSNVGNTESSVIDETDLDSENLIVQQSGVTTGQFDMSVDDVQPCDQDPPDFFADIKTNLDLLEHIDKKMKNARTDLRIPRNLSVWVKDWLAEGQRPSVVRLIDRLKNEELEPQLAIEYLLSNRWLNWTDRETRHRPRFRVMPPPFHLRGDSFDSIPEEMRVFRGMLDVENKAQLLFFPKKDA